MSAHIETTQTNTVTGNVNKVGWNKDGNLLSIADTNSLVHVWGLETSFNGSKFSAGSSVYSVEYNEAMSSLAAGLENGDIEIRDTEDWTLNNTVSVGSDPVKDVSWRSDGSELLAACGNKGYVIDTSTWSVTNELDFMSSTSDTVEYIVFNNDDSIILLGGVVADDNDGCFVVDATDWTEITVLTSNSSRGAVWGPNGDYLAITSGTLARIYDTDYNNVVNLDSATDIVYDVAWTRDNKHVIYSDGGGNYNVYTHLVSDWSEDVILEDANSAVHSLEVGPKNNYLASATYGGDVFIYDLSTKFIRMNTLSADGLVDGATLKGEINEINADISSLDVYFKYR